MNLHQDLHAYTLFLPSMSHIYKKIKNKKRCHLHIEGITNWKEEITAAEGF